jgi:hypothetical protein
LHWTFVQRSAKDRNIIDVKNPFLPSGRNGFV